MKSPKANPFKWKTVSGDNNPGLYPTIILYFVYEYDNNNGTKMVKTLVNIDQSQTEPKINLLSKVIPYITLFDFNR